ncbi:MAG TPA: DEAD/DEAH box helicase [Chitinophagaceae bacterium]
MTIVETVKDYEVSFDYDFFKVQALKKIDGAWYQGAKRVWHIPRHREKELNYLRQKFHVTELGVAEPEIPAQQYDDVSELPDLDVEIPLLIKPYGYQEKGIAYSRLNKRVIIGDQPGLGKTLQAIGTICSFGITDNMLNAGPGLIICPSSLKINWKKEWMEVAGRRAMILSDNIKNTWQQYYKVGMCDVFIVNYESLKKYFVQSGWSKPKEGQFKMNQIPFRENISVFKWLVIDESHKCKDGTTQQSKFVMGIAKEKDIVLELTGTPVLNKSRDLITQLHIIDRLRDVVSHIPQPKDKNGRLADFSGYSRFINRYCGGGNESTNLKELNYRLYKYCFFRREKSEVLKDLPDKMRQVVRCDITNRTEYDKAQNEFSTYLKEVKGCSDQEIKKKLRGQMMVKMGILKTISAKGKLDAAKEFIEEVTDGGQKIVVFIHLKEIAAELKRMFPTAVSITGSDSMEERDRAIDAFQKCKVCGTRLENHKNKDHAHVLSDTNIIICSSAGGVGVTLTASSEVLFIEYPWTFAMCEQYEDRTTAFHRKIMYAPPICLVIKPLMNIATSISSRKRKASARKLLAPATMWWRK